MNIKKLEETVKKMKATQLLTGQVAAIFECTISRVVTVYYDDPYFTAEHVRDALTENTLDNLAQYHGDILLDGIKLIEIREEL